MIGPDKARELKSGTSVGRAQRLLTTCGRKGHHKGSYIVDVVTSPRRSPLSTAAGIAARTHIRIAPLRRTYDFGLALAPDERKSDIEWVWLSSLVRSEHLASTLAFREGRSPGDQRGRYSDGSPVAGLGLAGIVGQETQTRELEGRLGVGGGPSRVTPRTWSTDTGFHGNATRPQVAPAAA